MVELLSAMPEATVRRTLVKSPPELWAEVSDTAALARHLGEFGEIRITRTDPETTVAWEGDRVRGTVELEASGWGTKVTITAEPSVRTPQTAAPAPTVEPEADREPELEEVAEPAPEPVATVESPPVPVDEPAPAPAPPPRREPKPGFFARLFGRRRAESAPVEPVPAPVVPLPTPQPVELPPAAVVAEPVTEPEPAAPEPALEPVAVAAPALEPDVTPEPDPESEPSSVVEPLDSAQVEGILTAVLDDLGAAHHRPFSR